MSCAVLRSLQCTRGEGEQSSPEIGKVDAALPASNGRVETLGGSR